MSVQVATAPAPQKLLLGLLIAILALFLGYLLVDAPFYAIMIAGLVSWLVTIPYHDRLAASCSILFSQSAFIVPFFPGPVYVAEVAALLGLTAIPLAVVFRRYPPDTGRLFRDNWMIFFGLAFYLMTLGTLMYGRGVGVGSLGGGVGGAKIYFQQVAYALVPMVLLLVPLRESLLIRLVVIGFILAFSFFISEVAFAYLPVLRVAVVNLLALPVDAFQFDMVASSFGIRRLQSLYFLCPKLIFGLLVCYSLKCVLGRRSWWLVPAILGLLVVGMVSGHRASLIHTGTVLLVIALVQRAVTPKNFLAGAAGLLVGLAVIYGAVSYMPPAMQRAVSFLPGLNVETVVAMDAKGTWQGRIEVTRRGLDMIPEYFWFGRGFTRYSDIYKQSLEAYSSTEYAILQGHFLNGFVGLMVNTGIWGALGMCFMLLGGTLLAVRMIREARRSGFEDGLARLVAVIASLFLVDAVFFFVVEGNVEGAMRRFAFQIAVLIACDRLFRGRAQNPNAPPVIVAARPAPFRS